MGGLARRVQWLKENRKAGEPSLLLEAGDSLFPGEYARGDIYKKRADYILKIYGMLKYDAYGVGRRDLPFGVEFLKEESKKYNVEFLSANLFLNNERPFEPYKIFNVGNSKVAVISIISPRSSKEWEAKGITVKTPNEYLKNIVPELRQKADLIVLLSNLGDRGDRKLVKEISGIDLVIGSGPGSRLKFPQKVAEKTYMVRPQNRGKAIGWVEIAVPFTGAREEIKGQLVYLTGVVKGDSVISKEIKALEKETRAWERKNRKRIPASPKNRKKAAQDNPFIKALKKAKMQKQPVGNTPKPASNSPLMEIFKKQPKAKPAPSSGNSSIRLD